MAKPALHQLNTTKVRYGAQWVSHIIASKFSLIWTMSVRILSFLDVVSDMPLLLPGQDPEPLENLSFLNSQVVFKCDSRKKSPPCHMHTIHGHQYINPNAVSMCFQCL